MNAVYYASWDVKRRDGVMLRVVSYADVNIIEPLLQSGCQAIHNDMRENVMKDYNVPREHVQSVCFNRCD